MNEIKTNKVITHGSSNLELVSSGGTVVITGSNLSTTADGMFTSGLDMTSDSETTLPSQPTAVNHLCRKDYVDRHTRIGATVCFGMRYDQGYDGQNRFEFSHTINSTKLGFPGPVTPTGSRLKWTGWAAVRNADQTINILTLKDQSGVTFANGDFGLNIPNWSEPNLLALFCLTRVS